MSLLPAVAVGDAQSVRSNVGDRLQLITIRLFRSVAQTTKSHWATASVLSRHLWGNPMKSRKFPFQILSRPARYLQENVYNSGSSITKCFHLLRAKPPDPSTASNNMPIRLRILYCRITGTSTGTLVCRPLSRMLPFLLCCIQNVTAFTSRACWIAFLYKFI